jgi:hypothetical protein
MVNGEGVPRYEDGSVLRRLINPELSIAIFLLPIHLSLLPMTMLIFLPTPTRTRIIPSNLRPNFFLPRRVSCPEVEDCFLKARAGTRRHVCNDTCPATSPGRKSNCFKIHLGDSSPKKLEPSCNFFFHWNIPKIRK